MSTITVPSKPDHARSFLAEQGKPSSVLRAQVHPAQRGYDVVSETLQMFAVTSLSPAPDKQAHAQGPFWCMGCDEVHPWDRMRWDGPLLLCQVCVHALCDHYPGRDGVAVHECEQRHGIRRAHDAVHGFKNPWDLSAVERWDN